MQRTSHFVIGFSIFLPILAGLAGCQSLRDLVGLNDQGPQLLLFASPRQPAGEALSISQVGVEAVGGKVEPRGVLDGGTLGCVRLTSYRGTLAAATAGAADCGGGRCLLLTLPPSRPQRSYAIYQPAQGVVGDILVGELFLLPRGDGGGVTCRLEALQTPAATSTLVLGVPDAPVPDLAAPVDAAVPPDATVLPDATEVPDAASTDLTGGP